MESGYTADIVDDPQSTLNGYERNCLFHNRGAEGFVDIGYITHSDSIEDGRGVGIADFDADGDLDILIQNYDRPTSLLMNERVDGKTAHWLQVKLVGTQSNRDAVGARISIEHGGSTQTREIACGAGYLSQQSLVAHFGLGKEPRVDRMTIRWPSGMLQELRDVTGDRKLRIVEPPAAGQVARRP